MLRDSTPFDFLCPVTMSHYPAAYKEVIRNPGEDALAHWKRNLGSPGLPNPNGTMLYVHVPFCDSFCTFCRYSREKPPDTEVVARYFGALKSELSRYLSYPYVAERHFDLVYFGGGTPSLVPIPILDDFLGWLRTRLARGGDLVIALEGESRSLKRRELLELLLFHGVRRVSVGVQSFDPELRTLLGRRETFAEIRETTEGAHALGLEVNFDLLHWLPGQTVQHIERDIATVQELSPTDVDWYVMTYDPLTRADPLSRMVCRRAGAPLAKLGTILEMRRAMRAGFEALGYRQHFVDNFSRVDEKDLYHRIRTGSYSGRSEVLGIGVSSLGTFAGYVYSNADTLDEYFASVSEDKLSFRWILELTPRRALERALFHFARNLWLPSSVLESVPPRDAEPYVTKIARLIAQGLVTKRHDGYSLTEDGRLWYSNVAAELTMDEERIRMLKVLYGKLQC